MAKFMKVHHRHFDGDESEYIINLDQIVCLDPNEKSVELTDGEWLDVRENEWNLILNHVNSQTL